MSSVLETFFILFSSNSDDVSKGAKDAEDATGGLQEELDKTDKGAKKAGGGFKQMVQEAKKAYGEIIALGGATAVLFFGVRYAEDLRRSSLAIGENVGEIEAWGRATQQFGGSAQSMQSTLKSLNNSIRETAYTGEGSLSPALRRLGLNLRDLEGNIKTPLQLLPEIADAFQGLDAAESMHLGEKLGLDQPTILLLQQGRREVELMLSKQRELGVLTEADTETSKKFNAQLADTGNTFLALRQKLVTSALPALTWLFEKLEDIGQFMADNRSIVEGFFIGASVAITAYYLPAMIRAAAATLAATWPLLLLVGIVSALVAVFAVVYDEITAFSKGSNSAIGEAVKRWPFLGDIIKAIAFSFQLLGEGIKLAARVASYVFSEWAESAGTLFRILGMGITHILDQVNNLWSVFKFIFSSMSDFLGKISGVIEKVTGSLFGDSDVSLSLNKAASAINFASSTPIAAQTSQSVVNRQSRSERSSSLNIGEVRIETQATDATGISQAIGQSLAEQINQAMYNYDDGVEA